MDPETYVTLPSEISTAICSLQFLCASYSESLNNYKRKWKKFNGVLHDSMMSVKLKGKVCGLCDD